MKEWEKINLIRENGELVQAIAPVIISASRSTDIPAFYSQWLINRISKNYLKWINPFNGLPQYISFNKTRLIVFWSKDPSPLLGNLDFFDDRGINYYFQFTLNNFEYEGLEPNIPPLLSRLEIFQRLSDKIGKEKVIWRFDPIILTDSTSINDILERLEYIGNYIYKFTNKLVISFADISEYRYVANNLSNNGIKYIDITKEQMIEIAQKIQLLNRNWRLQIASCAEAINLEKSDIIHNRCIDDGLIAKLFSRDKELMSFIGFNPLKQLSFLQPNSVLNNTLKDKGQRKACGCIKSKDIGVYSTCGHGCLYCYANRTPPLAITNLAKHNPNAESIV